MVILVLGALLAGLTEAFFLVAVTRVALAITGGADQVSVTTSLSLEVTTAVLFCAAVLVLRMVSGLTVAFLQTSVMYRVTVAVRQELLDTYFGAPWELASLVAPGEFQQIVVEYPARATSVTAKVTTLMSNALSLGALVAASLLVDWGSTLLVVASLSVLSTLILPLRRIIGRRSRLSAGKQLELANEVDEARSILLEATTFGATRDVATSLSKLGRESAEANRRLSVAINVSPQIYSTLAYVSVLVALSFASGLGGENLDGVGAVMLIMLRALGYGQQIQSGAVALMEMVPYLGRINDFVKGFDSLERRQGDLPLPPRANLSLSAVSFKYPDREAAFSNFDLNVDFGKSVAVIGPSGSGKSTLLQLLLGIRRPTSGGIRFGDNDLQMISEEDFRRKVAFVPQATTLVSGTILDNVRFFRPWVDDSMVDDALRRAGIVDEVASLPSGVNTEIGSLGNRLSGGQRQRIAIARALAGKPSFLLMDEPTSALDSESEALIAQLINSLRGVCTVIVVAHRPGTIEACEVTVTVQKPD